MTSPQAHLTDMLLEELGYAGSSALRTPEKLLTRRPIPGIERAFFVGELPVAYFTSLAAYDTEELLSLHRRVWNECRVPLLYVVLPDEIRVYNGFEPPPPKPSELDANNRLLRHLRALTDVQAARRIVAEQLEPFHRLRLEAGTFWGSEDAEPIKWQRRADRLLCSALVEMLRILTADKGLAREHAFSLIGRTLFVQYLEDRGILREDDFSVTSTGASLYAEVLRDKSAAYQLFAHLAGRFGQDLFRVSEEEQKAVHQDHLSLVSDFLQGTDLKSHQRQLFPYDLKFIPIELISGIYDSFLHADDENKLGMFFTPQSLVDFILDETLPVAEVTLNERFLDPSCGSGIFLVRAFQRLVRAWQQQHARKPGLRDLTALLRRSVFGVDVSEGAILFAAFSLHLALLDHLEVDAIRHSSTVLPTLIGANLLATDFFSDDLRGRFGPQKFDRVIGNPPWGKSTLQPNARAWLHSKGYSVGSKQIAQAFLTYAPQFCTDDGEVAMLAPAKGSLLVTSEPHRKFRNQFLARHDIRACVNFSAMSKELFPTSGSPAVAFFYRAIRDNVKLHERICYGVPKPTPLSKRLAAVVLEPSDIRYLQRSDLLSTPHLWKIALWGTQRDAALIQRLADHFPTLKITAKERSLLIKEGYQVGGGDENPAPWLTGLPGVNTNRVPRYVLLRKDCKPVKERVFHRTRKEEIYRAPLAVIRQSASMNRCWAAFSEFDVAYKHKLTGVIGTRGQEDLLKWIVAFINSSLCQYYLFHTSASWAIERPAIVQKEYEELPCVLPEPGSPRLRRVVELFDSIAMRVVKDASSESSRFSGDSLPEEREIADEIFKAFKLTQRERRLVEDFEEYVLPQYVWSELTAAQTAGNEAFRRVTRSELDSYASEFSEVAYSVLKYNGSGLKAHAYGIDAPLCVVAFERTDQNKVDAIRFVEGATELGQELNRLDELLIERHGESSFIRRNARIYDGSFMYLIRPNQARYWTRTQALVDAENSVAEWVQVGRSLLGSHAVNGD